MEKFKEFDALNISSKFAICGLPLRVDTYRTCSFMCEYCFSNNRTIVGSARDFQVAGVDKVERRLDRLFNKKEIDPSNFLDKLILDGITWHCGGMSDPFQPCEEKLQITKKLVDVTNKYGIHILFSTKTNSVYDCDLRPELHAIQMSVTNMEDRTDLEPNVPSIQSRYEFFRKMKAAGFRVGIRIQPFMPDISGPDIIEAFKDADYFTIEGLKLVPTNPDHCNYLMDLMKLKPQDFVFFGLLNLKPHIRLKMYKDTIAKLQELNIPFSLADNDLHQVSSGKCCCGDPLINKSTDFNNTALAFKYGIDYTLDDVLANVGEYKDCKAAKVFFSRTVEGNNWDPMAKVNLSLAEAIEDDGSMEASLNRRKPPCETVWDFFEKRFPKVGSTFSPKFLYTGDGTEYDVDERQTSIFDMIDGSKEESYEEEGKDDTEIQGEAD